MIDCLINFYNFNKEYSVKSKYSDQMFVCNSNSINAIAKELYRRVLIPFYIFIVSFIASILILVNKDRLNYNKYRIVLIILIEISNSFLGRSSLIDKVLIFAPFALFLLSYFIIFNKFTKKIT